MPLLEELDETNSCTIKICHLRDGYNQFTPVVKFEQSWQRTTELFHITYQAFWSYDNKHPKSS
jgi:hypothetical protein